MQRDARQSRPQLVIVLGDNSTSMSEGQKAEAATEGIREMICECQMKGPPGKGLDYFRIAFIRFAMKPELLLNAVPAREIDPDSIEIQGDGGGTNITDALNVTYDCLKRFVSLIEEHPERDRYPMPLVVLFSDGYNGYGKPVPVAEKIKALNIDGWPVTIAAAGIATPGSKPPDEELLKQIASPECYERIEDVSYLTEYLAAVGSSGASSPRDVADVIRRLRKTRPPQHLEPPAPRRLPPDDPEDDPEDDLDDGADDDRYLPPPRSWGYRPPPPGIED